MLEAKVASNEYAHEGGVRCPVCLSEEISGGESSVDGNQYWQTVTCDNCHCGWTEYYVLAGYDDLEETEV